MSYLEEALKAESKTARKLGCQMLVCLSAASNVTGILVDTNAASSLVHRYGGIVFWDYATAAPYVEMNMNPAPKNGAEDAYKDAIFFSVHKFVGGPQTPGILVAKKKLFEAGEQFPFQSGGGTVNFVRREHTSYFKEVEVREEGGTPAIIESIRAGMVIQLKEAIGSKLIQKREEELVRMAWTKFSQCPNLVILGGSKAKRIAIFSFLVRHTRDSIPYANSSKHRMHDPSCKEIKDDNCLFIHHDFICSLLNDLFGIQSRSGCACAGPYALDLLGINEELAISYEDTLISKDNEEIFEHKILRPGFTRVNLPFFYPDEEIDFIIESIIFVAKYSWTFLPFYELNQTTGQWRYCNDKRSDMGKHLSNISYDHGVMRWKKPAQKSAGPVPLTLRECLSMAASLQQSLESVLRQSTCSVTNEKIDRYWMRSKVNYLRWFLLASEAAADARGLPRPIPQYPNMGSPWHPGCIERCFCPDLAKRDNESLSRLCKYTSAKMADAVMNEKHIYLNGVRKSNHCVNSSSSSDSSMESQSGTDIICVRRGGKENRGSPNRNSRSRGHASRIGRLGACERYPINFELPRGLIRPHRTQSSSPARHLRGETSWRSPPPQLLRPTIQNPDTSISSEYDDFSEGEVTGLGEEENYRRSPLYNEQESMLYRLYSDKWNQALRLFSMIHPGDRILVHLSGGKSSMALLHCLHAYQEMLQQENPDPEGRGVFDMGAVVVALAYENYDLLPLVNYLKALGVTYYYEKQDMNHYCSHSLDLCSSLKQKVIYNVARKYGYTVLALAQNLDEMAASFLSSVFNNGSIQTMEANVELKDLKLRLIRPLAFCREKTITEFVKTAGLPVMKTACPICEQSKMEQVRLKEILAAEENNNPHLFSSIISAISPLLHLSSQSNIVYESDTIPQTRVITWTKPEN
ncbi:tRNA-cytidine 32 2-sulfurtransferase [Taenia crassiceps]|uniref:tRNA-cytidine 32 2-sulfurtransferase n=1 Tax=Taenia crassiceps TaxID=6207 RepID=A0ABR4QSA5_9CEST